MMLLNIVVGFGFQSLIAARIGLSPLADSFQGTWAVVTFGATVQLTLVTSLLVPHLQTTSSGLPTLTRTRLPLLLGAFGAVCQASGALFAGGVSQALLLASAPSHIFVAATAVPLARAYVNRRFVTAGAGAIANGVALLIVTALGDSVMGPWLLGSALSVGYMAQWAATIVGLRGVAPFAPGVGISFRLFAGVAAYTMFSKLQPVLERAISLSVAEGATSALGFGQKVASGLLLVGTFSLALTTTAALSRYVRAQEWERAGTLLSKTTVASFALTSAVVAVALPLAYPVVVILFQRGEFTRADSVVVTDIVIAQLPWVLAAVLTGVFTAFLYALGWYSKVLFGSAAGLIGMAASSLLLAGTLPMTAVAVGGSVGAISALLFIAVLVSRSPVGVTFGRALRERVSLVLKAVCLLVASVVVYASLAAVDADHQFWPGVIAGTALSVVLLAYVTGSRATRLQLKEALGAEV